MAEASSCLNDTNVETTDGINPDNVDNIEVNTNECVDTAKPGTSTNEGHVESATNEEPFCFKCIFCDQVLTANERPKLLECLHNSCATCLSGIDKNHLECPSCSIPIDSLSVIDNQFLLELAHEDNSTKITDIKCSSCSDDANATSWCVDCSEYICDNCVQAHQRLKITKDHTIKPKEDGMNENNLSGIASQNNLFCLVHPHERLSLFCEGCDKLTCRDCQLTEHREHKYKFTNEIASETRRVIADVLKDVGYKRVLLNSAMKVIEDRQALIGDKKQSLVNEITQLVVKLTNTINLRGKQLVTKLNDVCDSKQKTLQEKKDALEQLSKMTDHCINFTQYALDNGSDMALLFSKRQLLEHLKKIKCRRADIPNPEIPVRINLALDKVPELIKVMSTIGQIVVDGRIYPSKSSSPSSNFSPLQTSSPNCQAMPQPQQQQQPSTLNQLNQRKSPPNYTNSGYSQSRLPPPYNQYPQNQYQGQNMAPNGQGMMGPPAMTSLNQLPVSLSLQSSSRIQQRPLQSQAPQQRLIPRIPPNAVVMTPHQQQVSSSTHPQPGYAQERSNLRGLLQTTAQTNTNTPVYIQTGPSQYQAVQPHVAQQFQTRFNPQYRQQSPVNATSTLRMMMSNQNRPINMQRTNSTMPYPPTSAKWHIPQQTQNSIGRNTLSLPTINDNFKITLKSQNNGNNPATVTSTIPPTKTPSPPESRNDTERNLDRYCEDSVKDLYATIAKLDSNGVQVLAESGNSRAKTGGSPHVDSSTVDTTTPVKIKSDPMDCGKDDPNEDWCAVCMDGGELVCCDKCPKVFHQYCHIPNIAADENDTWQCLLCMNFADIPDDMLNDRKDGGLSYKDKKICERIILEMYCQYDPSLPFREVIGPEIVDYHSIIKNPIALDTIRQKLNWENENHYTSIDQMIQDVRLMFRNAYTYNAVDSLVYNDAKSLEQFFDQQLEKFLPEYIYEACNEDEIQPPNKRFRRIITD